MQVQTVTGKVSTDNWNYVLMHEHILIGYAGWQYDPNAPKWKRSEARNQIVDRLIDLKNYGVSCIVDPCPIDLGRDPVFLAEVSEMSGVDIVCATGFDLEDRGGPQAIRQLSEKEIYEIYMHEINYGIEDTGIKPGIIKVCTGYKKISDYEEKCLKAASKASLTSGLPIITHTEKGTMGNEQLKLFKNEGVPAEKCLIGHCCANHNTNYHKEIMDDGAYVGFDRFGNDFHGSDDVRFQKICELIRLGYSKQLIISCDSVMHFLGRAPKRGEAKNWNPFYIFYGIIPTLLKMGISQNNIDQILKINPKIFLSNKKMRGA